MAEYVITLEADRPPEILLGQNIFGGKVTALNLSKKKLVSASELAQKYGLSATTVREKLNSINQGTSGKHLYDPDLADVLLKTTKRRRSRTR
ncbi:HTH domain-containing protein [Acinetobacter bereziniae]|uniref:HTH domain-containing protein n=1 Tax=Acinetobacter bereziniae TaxID=106648 RepID=UPI00124FA7A4|nr:HTH domain-containing protein [Acinetobacter bereziniae]MBJ9903644.1 HTH domain-containing protein [Acinetobacter bereziniae]MCU4321666.1 GntR family transcriptional regulator [Acinetobacter bereziniae]MCU4601318.1 GntR family transcriptional regulator [Acinetobacter bereziniae]